MAESAGRVNHRADASENFGLKYTTYKQIYIQNVLVLISDIFKQRQFGSKHYTLIVINEQIVFYDNMNKWCMHETG